MENNAMNEPSIWNPRKLKSIAEKYHTDCVYVCRKNGSDAVAVVIDEDFAVLPKSRVAPADKAFNAKITSVQDLRRISEKFGRITDGELNRIRRFTTLAKAAQFVSAKHSARSSDWKKVFVGK